MILKPTIWILVLQSKAETSSLPDNLIRYLLCLKVRAAVPTLYWRCSIIQNMISVKPRIGRSALEGQIYRMLATITSLVAQSVVTSSLDMPQTPPMMETKMEVQLLARIRIITVEEAPPTTQTPVAILTQIITTMEVVQIIPTLISQNTNQRHIKLKSMN